MQTYIFKKAWWEGDKEKGAFPLPIPTGVWMHVLLVPSSVPMLETFWILTFTHTQIKPYRYGQRVPRKIRLSLNLNEVSGILLSNPDGKEPTGHSGVENSSQHPYT